MVILLDNEHFDYEASQASSFKSKTKLQEIAPNKWIK